MHTGPILEGKGDTDYERYVRVPELLALQKEKEQLAHPEERLFQTTHQAAELWLHQVDYEIDRAAEMIADDQPQIAADLLNRCRLNGANSVRWHERTSSCCSESTRKHSGSRRR